LFREKKISLPEYFQDGYVLVADDIANMRRTVKNMLRQLGIINVEVVEDGNAVIRRLKVDGDSCLFVLLDWNMPVMPGIYVTREIRADSAMYDLPIMMVTAEADKNQIAQAVEVGVSGYILKPFVTQVLQDKILNVIMAREQPPEFVRLLNAGNVLVKKGEYGKALSIYNHALALRNTARVMVQIGELYELMGEGEKALAMYNNAVENNPMYLKAYVKAAEAHLKNDEQEEALVFLQKAREISPINHDRSMTMGNIHLKKGEDEKAAKHYNDAIKIAPEKAMSAAEELLSHGKAAKAEELLRRALEKDRKNISVVNRLGISLRRQGKWREAIREYERGIMMEPADEALHFNMGKAYAEGRDFKMAIKLFERVLQINPELEEAEREIEAINISLGSGETGRDAVAGQN